MAKNPSIKLIFLSFLTTVSKGDVTGFALGADSAPIADSLSKSRAELEWLRVKMRDALGGIKGEWLAQEDWKGFGCFGSYKFRIRVDGLIEDIHIENSEMNFLSVHAHFSKLRSELWGSYRSDYSLCTVLAARFDVLAEALSIKAEIRREVNGELFEVSIKDVSINGLDFGKDVPTWFEKNVEGALNQGFAVIWRTQIGTWINSKLNHKLRDWLKARPTVGVLAYQKSPDRKLLSSK